MANYSMADVKALREQTGAGMMDVKKALDEADGDQERALELIRLKGLKSLSKREDRSTSAGMVMIEVGECQCSCDEKQVGVMVEVNAETDFVVKNEKFLDFAKKVMAAAVASKAHNAEELLAAPAEEGTVQDMVNALSAVIGEKIVVSKCVRLKGERVESYLHYSSQDLPPQVGVMVACDEKAAEVAHDVAMHIAAYQPDYLSREDVPADALAKERALLEEKTREEGKPENMIEKIVEGRLNGFYKENCLLDQAYAKDPSTTVGKVVSATGGKLTGFVRFHVGA